MIGNTGTSICTFFNMVAVFPGKNILMQITCTLKGERVNQPLTKVKQLVYSASLIYQND